MVERVMTRGQTSGREDDPYLLCVCIQGAVDLLLVVEVNHAVSIVHVKGVIMGGFPLPPVGLAYFHFIPIVLLPFWHRPFPTLIITSSLHSNPSPVVEIGDHLLPVFALKMVVHLGEDLVDLIYGTRTLDQIVEEFPVLSGFNNH